MVIKVLGASSKGNCYLLEDKDECLILDAGISFKEVKKTINFNVSKIVGVLVTHVHGDHAKYVKDYESVGIKVIKPYEDDIETITTLGKFRIQTFALQHDVPCFGFYIKWDDERLIYATDTEYIKYKFNDINHIIVECNYSYELLQDNYHKSLKERVMISHMELLTCKEFIKVNKSKALRSVTLIHLSDSNSDEALFKREVEQLVNCPVYIASAGLNISLDREPF